MYARMHVYIHWPTFASVLVGLQPETDRRELVPGVRSTTKKKKKKRGCCDSTHREQLILILPGMWYHPKSKLTWKLTVAQYPLHLGRRFVGECYYVATSLLHFSERVRAPIRQILIRIWKTRAYKNRKVLFSLSLFRVLF